MSKNFKMTLNTQNFTQVDAGMVNYTVPNQIGAFHPTNFPHFNDPNQMASYFYQQPLQMHSYPSFEHQRQMRIENHKHSIQKQHIQQIQENNNRPKPIRFVSGHYDLDAPKRKYQYRKNSQKEILDNGYLYLPADSNANINQFSKEDIIILKNILPNAEIHKWKYISNRLSKTKSKKLNTEYCINKFHQMYDLPFNKNNNPLDSKYGLKINSKNDFNIDIKNNGDNFEGMMGSSLGYILSRDGWNLIDKEVKNV